MKDKEIVELKKQVEELNLLLKGIEALKILGRREREKTARISVYD